jgi:hypothetical protein
VVAPCIISVADRVHQLKKRDETGGRVRFYVALARGNFAELPALARKLVDLKPDVIVVFQTPAAEAAKKATTIIPIVLEVADPVGTGLVDSLARPGGNITGVSAAITELGAKNLELAKEALPRTRRVAILGDTMNPFSKQFTDQAMAAAKTLDIEAKSVPVRAAGELESAFADLAKWRPDAVLVLPSLPLKRVADLALKHQLPSFSPRSEFAGRRRAALIFGGFRGALPPMRGIRGQDFERKKARRPASRTAHQVPSGRQPQGSASLGTRLATNDADPRRRSDRMTKRREFIMLLGGAAARVAARGTRAAAAEADDWVSQQLSSRPKSEIHASVSGGPA